MSATRAKAFLSKASKEKAREVYDAGVVDGRIKDPIRYKALNPVPAEDGNQPRSTEQADPINEPVQKRTRGPGKNPSKVATSIQIDRSDLDALRLIAERDDRTLSSVIRLAVKKYISTEVE